MAKILLLELSTSDSCSRSPGRYGGAGSTLRRLAENIPNCYITAEKSCFEDDVNDKCVPLEKWSIDFIRNGYLSGVNNAKLDNHIVLKDYDILVYCNPSLVLETVKPQLVWALGAYERIHPGIKHLLVHNLKWQQPQIQTPETKIHEFVLGIDIPPFEEYQKEDFIFSCGNQYSQVNSHVLANWAVRNKMKIVFAGPIDPTYKKTFLSTIDYNWAIYIGQIDEEEKIKLMKKSRCYVDLVLHNINGPRLSVKQAWSHGCSVISTSMGIMPEVIQPGINGFLINNEDEFINAIAESKQIKQLNCYNTSLQWSTEKMCSSFLSVVNNVLGK